MVAFLRTMDVYEQIRNKRRTKTPLREQLLWRISQLGGNVDLCDPKNAAAFREVFAAFEPPGFTFEPLQGRCKAVKAGGGSILIGGILRMGDSGVAFVQRRFLLQSRAVIHEYLYVHPEARGKGINVVLLTSLFQLYDEMDMREVLLQAGLASGRWHWARVGFDFLGDADLEKVRNWFVETLDKLGIDLRADRYTSAAQFARMGGNRTLSLQQILDVYPERKTHILEIADGNGLRLDERIPLARALLLCGPEWFGRMDLQGPGRIVFDQYAQRKIARLSEP